MDVMGEGKSHVVFVQEKEGGLFKYGRNMDGNGNGKHALVAVGVVFSLAHLAVGVGDDFWT